MSMLSNVVYLFHKYRLIDSAVVIFSRQLGKTKISLMVFLASTDYLQSPDRKKEYEVQSWGCLEARQYIDYNTADIWKV